MLKVTEVMNVSRTNDLHQIAGVTFLVIFTR